MRPELPQPFALGDVTDVGAYVWHVVQKLGYPLDETEELVGDGFELVSQKHAELPPGASLKGALDRWLTFRLRDRWRARHPEWRRNTRAGTTYGRPVPTGLAIEHGGPDRLAGEADLRVVESRLALASSFERERDLRDPRRLGRYLGMPSVAALATGAAREIWAAIVTERELTAPPAASSPPPFRFIRGL